MPRVKHKVLKALTATRLEVQMALRRRHFKMQKDDQDDLEEWLSTLSLEELKKLGLIKDDLATVANDGGSIFLSQLNVTNAADMFGQVNERAVAYAQERAGELITGIDESTRDALRDIITKGLADGLPLSDISENLADAYPFSEDRADLIAKTEVAAANGNGSLEGMRAAQDHGVALKKVWLPDAEACDDCQDNGDDGPIDLDDTFSTGDDAPPAHPNCRCDMASDVEEETDDEGGDNSDESGDEE